MKTNRNYATKQLILAVVSAAAAVCLCLTLTGCIALMIGAATQKWYVDPTFSQTNNLTVQRPAEPKPLIIELEKWRSNKWYSDWLKEAFQNTGAFTDVTVVKPGKAPKNAGNAQVVKLKIESVWKPKPPTVNATIFFTAEATLVGGERGDFRSPINHQVRYTDFKGEVLGDDPVHAATGSARKAYVLLLEEMARAFIHEAQAQGYLK